MTQTNTLEQLDFAQNNLEKHSVNIHKFGGSSLATPECLERVVSIICRHCQLNDIIVVSANGKTTDLLLSLQQLALSGEPLDTSLALLSEQQTALIYALLNAENAGRLAGEFEQDLNRLVAWLAEDPAVFESDILALGEIWSARLLSALLNERICASYYLDARDFLVIDNPRDCRVDNPVSKANLQNCRRGQKLAVITGFICKDHAGNSCTLGRNGSDYSATIFASLLSAKNVTLWTDVDGIYSADPRVVPSARKLHRLPNAVARELGRLGNPVLHKKTLQPLTGSIGGAASHLHVASSFDVQAAATEIGEFGQIARQELSVTHLNDLLLVTCEALQGDVLADIVAEFSPVYSDQKSGQLVILASQQKALTDALAVLGAQLTVTPVSLIAAVGYQVALRLDIYGRFKRALKNDRVLRFFNSEEQHSIIALLPQETTPELLNKVHHEIVKDARHIGLVVAGLGNIGQRFLELLPGQLSRIPALENVHLVGLVSSKKALIQPDGLEVNSALADFSAQATDYTNGELLDWLKHHPYDEMILVDITPSEAFSRLYGEFFDLGIHVIGANKWAASAGTDIYHELKNKAGKSGSLWLGNTTVGAGLPVNYALDDLLGSGDQITEISGVFSGTLSWLFEHYDAQKPFSVLLKEALAQGITEPDPREDLSGRDVQRKLLILARAAGFELSLEDINCQNLVPESLQELGTEAFLQQAAGLDAYFLQQYQQANEKNACIRYIARFSSQQGKVKAGVSLELLAVEHAFANLTPCDNIFQIKSHWYQDNPLIIRGPGAGRDVTAGGLHSDLVTACRQLVNKQHQVTLKGIN
ncbi:bifunctional aspartate kinase/homoserine dehydrogenase II [Thalassomonas viridans]|uniref:Bifunctional aspartokinase/homoserine dehydrogenase n=1 Tax=Thalassomonas viridans TaxID=137584 RepID=A0AAE9Z2C3_9GAMM|nr:bifunctional aspartate kinase/homoserine dehydrogenase II [Thalassomonas viridans]WDE04764.1 bifunctional aspartate kinase/homoserine dehydrogenase II [Thalassomonas viridans]